MPGYVAFLRGINVGGHRVTGGEIVDCFESVGFSDVVTFRASGNVIFTAESSPESKIVTQIESVLADSLGYAVPTYLRTEKEVLAIAETEPFQSSQTRSFEGKLQVALLTEKPPIAKVKDALAFATPDDLLTIQGRELYWLPRGRMSDSELDLKGVTSAVGPTTIRTIGTIEQIAVKYFS